MNGWRACAFAGLLALLTACSKEPAPAGSPDAPAAKGPDAAASESSVLAEFADRKLTVKDLNDYFKANLYVDGGVEDIAAADLKILQSRLFDAFVDEELLLHEAKLAGIEVSPEEVEAYAQSMAGEEVEDATTEAMRRETARKDLTIQKLRSTWVQSNVKVTPAEIAKYAEEHRSELEPQRSVVLRTVMFPTEAEARKISADIKSQRLTFEQALDTPGVNKAQAAPSRVRLEDLPAEVRDVVEGLGAGQVSDPLLVNGRPFLFHVVSWVKPSGNLEEAILERAEAGLLRQKQEDASRDQVFGARQRIPTKLHLENLPFQYVPSS
jgi:hypothetical protein